MWSQLCRDVASSRIVRNKIGKNVIEVEIFEFDWAQLEAVDVSTDVSTILLSTNNNPYLSAWLQNDCLQPIFDCKSSKKFDLRIRTR